MKNILGLDLGTNSIGWSLIKLDSKERKGSINGLGSRIIPMSQEILGEFNRGNSVSQTAARTGFRSTRRLRERHLLRRERLYRVLDTLNFLPEHFAVTLDKFGKFNKNIEPKIAYKDIGNNKSEFLFNNSYNEMLEDFRIHQPELLFNKNGVPCKIPYDWTIYYLRKKALSQKIDKEELAWLLIHFNQKRGYYQLRGEDEEQQTNKIEEFYHLKIVEIKESGEGKKEGEIWYSMTLENGWIYRRPSTTPLFDWLNKSRDFIVTTELNDDGSIKKDKEGLEKRSFRAPSDDDWNLRKKKTENDILSLNKTVGEYIYDSLLKTPNQKIKGALIRTIERKFYKSELHQILKAQLEFHEELRSKEYYTNCILALYENNHEFRSNISNRDFEYLFIDNIIFYQRPLKSKKSEIANCPFECRKYKNKDGKEIVKPLKCIPKSHPLFQEFRLWQWIQNIRIYEREKTINGKSLIDYDITSDLLKDQDDYVELFDFLNNRKEINQKAFLAHFGKKFRIDKFRWNFIDDDKKVYPCNETKTQLITRLNKVSNLPEDFLTQDKEIEIWHLLYSITDKIETEKALLKFASKHKIDAQSFVENFKKYPLIKSEFGAFSQKAITKLLPLMRMGKYWKNDHIHPQTSVRINKIIDGEFDETIKDRVREKSIELKSGNDFSALPLWLASYIVYDRHSEASQNDKWKTPEDISQFLIEFKQHSLRNPIVEQVLTETLRVVKDIWTHYGNGIENFFDEIHIELGRDMKNNAADRKSISENNNKNELTNLRIKSLLLEFSKPEYAIENVRPYSPSQQDILRIYEEGVMSSGIEIPDDILKISKSSQPNEKEILKYKLWIEQKYRSPYTGEIIPLSRLFTHDYEIEHIIPQSVYFDDSFSNKVICESEINKLKDNQFGFEFISKLGTSIVPLNGGKTVKVFNKDEYEDFVKQHYSNNRAKMKKLLLNDVPEKMIERQLNDTRYISKIVKNILSKIVRAEDSDDGITSKNIISSNGNITGILKQDWGFNDVWNDLITPRFERLNKLTNSENFGKWTNKDGHRVFQTQLPLELQKGFNKKRIDHRHHALDALIIACVTRNHINYLNNQHALDKSKKKSKEDKQKDRQELKQLLCFKTKPDSNGNYKWKFHKPWESLTQEAKDKLETTIVSFKQNLRVINKTVNHYSKYVDGEKQLVKQVKGDNWAIRKPMHKDTISGLVKLRKTKEVSLSYALDDYKNIALNDNLKNKISVLYNEFNDKKKVLKFFKDLNMVWNNKDITRVNLYYFENEMVASRTSIDVTFNSDKIRSITDTGIQKILLQRLALYNEIKNGETFEHPELAFSPEGIEEMNKNILEYNNGILHQPIKKVRTFEPKGNKFQVGYTSNKTNKYAEAAKGTNLFFAVYKDQTGKRSYDTIPLNIVIERFKQGLNPIPEKENHALLFWLSPNDLVYVPTEDELAECHKIEHLNLAFNQHTRIYKIVSFTNNRLYAIPHLVAQSIVDKIEFSQLNKMEFSLDKLSIKENCLKLSVDRLGNTQNPIK